MFDIPVGARHIVIEENETSPHMIGEFWDCGFICEIVISCLSELLCCFVSTPIMWKLSSNQRRNQTTVYIVRHAWIHLFRIREHHYDSTSVYVSNNKQSFNTYTFSSENCTKNTLKYFCVHCRKITRSCTIMFSVLTIVNVKIHSILECTRV